MNWWYYGTVCRKSEKSRLWLTKSMVSFCSWHSFSWPPAESAGEQQTETFQSEGQRLRPKRKSKESKGKIQKERWHQPCKPGFFWAPPVTNRFSSFNISVSLENKHAKYPEDNTTTTTLKVCKTVLLKMFSIHTHINKIGF